MLMTDICRRLPLLHLGNPPEGGGGGALPQISHIGMCRPKEYGFCAVLVPNAYRLCLFWSGIVHGFRGNYGSVLTYLSFPIANE